MPEIGRIDSVVDIQKIQAEINTVEGLLVGLRNEMKAVATATAQSSKGGNSQSMKQTVDTLKQLDEATAKLNHTYTEQEKELLRLKELQKQKDAAIRAETKALATNTAEWNKLLAAQREAANRYKEVATAQGVNSKAAKEALNDYKKLRQETDKINQSMGNHQANVGNYTSAVNGLKNAFAQLGAVIGLTALVQFGKESFKAYEEQVKNERLLNNALKERSETAKLLIQQATLLSTQIGIPDDEIMKVQTLAAAHGLTSEQIQKTTLAAANYAALMGVDLDQAAKVLLGTFEGQVGKLGKLDEEFTKLTKTQLRNGEVIDIINTKYANFGTESATATSKLSVAWEEFKESSGNALTFLTPLLNSWTDALGGVAGKSKANTLALKAMYEGMNDKELLATMNAENNMVLQQMRLGNDNYKVHIKNKQIAQGVWELRKRVREEDLKAENTLETQITNTKKHTEVIKEDADVLKYRKAVVENMTTASAEYLKNQEKIRKEAELWLEQANKFEDVKLPWEKDSDQLVDFYTKLKASEDQLKELGKEIKNLALDTGGSILSSLFGANAEDQISAINESLEAWHSGQLENIEERKAKGITTDKQYQAEKDKLEKQYEQKKKEALRKEAQIKKDQALWEIAINTAVAVAKVAGNPFQIALAVATGLAQAAIVASKPIPKYAKGRDGGKGEYAIVGEEGREAIELPSGERYLTPSRSTLTYLPDGAKVIPNISTFGGMQAMNENSTGFPDMGSYFNDLKTTIKGLPITTLNVTEKGFYTTVQKGASLEIHLSNNVKV